MKDLTQGKVSWRILRFALPMLLGSMFQQLYNIVDSWVVGNYIGAGALAAVGASFPLLFVMIALIIGVSSGMTVVISQFFGAKKFEKVSLSIDTMYIFAFFASIVMTILGIFFARDIFMLVKLDPEIVPMATLYFQIYMGGLVLLFGFNGTNAILRGLGDSMTPLVFMIISSLLNVGLDLLFVPFMGWGIEGVAIATVIAQGSAFIGGAVYLNRSHPLIKFNISRFRFDRQIFRQSLRIGLPTGLQQSFVALGMLALVRIVNDFGADAMAAYAVAGRLDSFAALPAMTFSSALSTFVGQNIGAGKLERVKRGFFSTWVITSIISVIVSVVAITMGREIIGFFTSEQVVIEIGYDYLIIASSFYIIFSSMFVTHGVLRGAGDTLIPMFITLAALWVIRVPLSWFLSRESVGLGTDGIWWGIPIAWAFGLLFSFIYFKTGRWKTKGVVRPAVAGQEISD